MTAGGLWIVFQGFVYLEGPIYPVRGVLLDGRCMSRGGAGHRDPWSAFGNFVHDESPKDFGPWDEIFAVRRGRVRVVQPLGEAVRDASGAGVKVLICGYELRIAAALPVDDFDDDFAVYHHRQIRSTLWYVCLEV